MRTIGFLLLALLSFGVAWSDPYPRWSHFESDAKPAALREVGNPLEYAAGRIGLDLRGVELPRAHEGGYRLACRFPIIDAVSNRPLFMKVWAEETTAAVAERHRRDPLEVIPYAARLLRGVADPEAFPEEMEVVFLSPLERKLAESNFTERYRADLLDLYAAFARARNLAAHATRDLAAEEIDFFDANPGYFLAPDGKTMPELTGSVETQFDFIERARRVDMAPIFAAADTLAAGVRRYIARTAAYAPADFFVDPSRQREIFVLDMLPGPIVVAGFGDDRHEGRAGLLIDLGGNDLYAGRVAGCASSRDGASLCIDHSGNDAYDAPREKYTQGFGFLGAGLLVDRAGDDRYRAGHFSQGAGILGVGAIWDSAGDDLYDADGFVQGAGMFGVGVLMDTTGEDDYSCATIGQGGATTLGLGILSDLDGDDRYELGIDRSKDSLGRTPGFGQGGALSFRHYPWNKKLTAYGGVGVLADAGGNDRYRSGGWCDQGGSYIMSLGCLVDDAGNDHYTSGTGLGSGIHVTNAIFIDRDGHDIYEGGFRTGGSGGDRSPGFFIDYRGNDIYRSRSSSFGTGCKPFSFSLFVDYEGDDSYISPEPSGPILFNLWDSFGGVWPESEPHLWPYAICLDLGGRDDYQARNRANDSERHSFGHGIHLDTEWRGGDLIRRVDDPTRAAPPPPLPESARALPVGPWIEELRSPDLFRRFQAIGRITAAGDAAVPALVEALLASTHRGFNRDLMECLHTLMVRGAVGDASVPTVARLLFAPDPEVRAVLASDAGLWRWTAADDGLIRLLGSDPDFAVRRSAAGALVELKSQRAAPEVRRLAVEDPSEEVRRVAVRYLGTVAGEQELDLLIRMLEDDPSPIVRVAAADALARIGDPRSLEAFRRAARSEDAYLRRAAGKGLASLFELEGLEVLIESLEFPSIDAFYNYGTNVPNTIAGFAGIDLPEAERYDIAAWRRWFRENRESIHLHRTAPAYREFTALTAAARDLPERERIARFEAFLADFPEHEAARKALAELLNQVAWRMVTAPAGSTDRDLAAGLAYAERAVELDPEPNKIDTLAEALEASGNLAGAIRVCEEALAQDPSQEILRARLERSRGRIEAPSK